MWERYVDENPDIASKQQNKGQHGNMPVAVLSPQIAEWLYSSPNESRRNEFVEPHIAVLHLLRCG